MMLRGGTQTAGLVLSLALTAGTAPAVADPEPPSPNIQPVAASTAEPAAAVDDGTVESSPPQTTSAPDGSTLTLSAKDETQQAAAPLTTAISTREYVVGGGFNGSVRGTDATPAGVLEVGYQIGCGIDMSTSNGVSLTGTAGINPSITYFGFDFGNVLPDGIAPGIGGNLGGGLTVGLKPGIINVVPVTKKQYKGSSPWVSVSNFRIKIDGCVGQSFIRSYAALSSSTDEGEAVLSWYGVTKAV